MDNLLNRLWESRNKDFIILKNHYLGLKAMVDFKDQKTTYYILNGLVKFSYKDGEFSYTKPPIEDLDKFKIYIEKLLNIHPFRYKRVFSFRHGILY